MNDRYGPARSLRPLLVTITIAWAALIVVRIVGVVLDWAAAAAGPPIGGIAAFRSHQSNRLVQDLVLAVVLLLVAVAGIAALAAWTARARRNAELVSPRPHRHGPGMAAGCWFIPFANAVLPWQAVTDVWLASDPDTRQLSPAAGPRSARTVNVWWGTVIGFGVLALVLTIALTSRPVVTYDFSSGTVIGGLDDYRSGLLRVALVNTVLLGGAAVIAVLSLHVLRQVTAWQEEFVGAAPVPQHAPTGTPFAAPAAPQPFGPLPAAGAVPVPLPMPPPWPPGPYPGAPYPGYAWQPAPARPPDGLAISVIVAVLLWLGTPWLAAIGVGTTLQRGTSNAATMAPFIAGFLGSIVLMILAGILVIVWQVQARAAAIRFAGPDAVAPGWVVAAWFIPVANLVGPPWSVYGILRAGAGERGAAGDGLLVGAWWISWLAAWTCTWIAFSRSLGSLAETRAAGLRTMSTVASGVWSLCALLFAVIVAVVRGRQRSLAATMR